jgi:hypothetical protein
MMFRRGSRSRLIQIKTEGEAMEGEPHDTSLEKLVQIVDEDRFRGICRSEKFKRSTFISTMTNHLFIP